MRLTILGAGFIGLNFIHSAIADGHDLTVLDHKPCPVSLLGRINWVQGDFFNDHLLEKVVHQAEVVCHFISTTVPGDEVDEAAEIASNVGRTLNLLKLCVKESVKRIIFISSASVYGVQTSDLINEKALNNPISSHGISKLTIEKYLQLYQYHHGLDCKILRLSNPFGPGQDVMGRQGFIAIAIGKILSGEPIMIRGDGSVIRDYIYIEDVCCALNALCTLDSDEAIFNIGSGVGYSLIEVVGKLSKLIGKSWPTIYTEARFVDIPESVLDISKAQQAFEFKCRFNLDEGLLRTLKHHKIPTL
jgi:UDP-glucose 4-epimerase